MGGGWGGGGLVHVANEGAQRGKREPVVCTSTCICTVYSKTNCGK